MEIIGEIMIAIFIMALVVTMGVAAGYKATISGLVVFLWLAIAAMFLG